MNIKKKLKIIIPGAMLVLGGLMIIAGLVSGAVGDYKNQLALTEFEANISPGNIFNIDIDVSLADVNVICTNDVTDFRIEGSNVTRDLIEYSTTNNTLRVRYETQKWYQAIFTPGYRSSEGVITLYIPAGITLKDVEITSGFGKSNISYITAEQIFIDCGDGDSQIRDLKCSYTEINKGSGDINGINIDAVNADLNFSSGSAVLSNFRSESAIINNGRNDLSLSGMITGNSSIATGSGDADITLYGEVTDYSFNVSDGDVTVNGKDAWQSQNAPYVLKLSGDININVK
ncbi:MAG: DUF4097 family beta strand repeat-containing protein [Porcipelethomonas sp.]